MQLNTGWAGCKAVRYDAEQAERDKAANAPYLAICQLETPGFDYEERLEPKTGPIANIRNRPRDGYQRQAYAKTSNSFGNVERYSDMLSRSVDRANESLAL